MPPGQLLLILVSFPVHGSLQTPCAIFRVVLQLRVWGLGSSGHPEVFASVFALASFVRNNLGV